MANGDDDTDIDDLDYSNVGDDETETVAKKENTTNPEDRPDCSAEERPLSVHRGDNRTILDSCLTWLEKWGAV